MLHCQGNSDGLNAQRRKAERPSSDSVPRADENGCRTCVPIIGAVHAPTLLDLFPSRIAQCIFVIQKASWPYTHCHAPTVSVRKGRDICLHITVFR